MQLTDADLKKKTRHAYKLLKGTGLKLTHQRLEILHILMSDVDHPSAEDIYERIKPKVPTISFDTVYRTLALFEHHGIISRVQYLDDKSRYDPNTARHYHFVCTRCRTIRDRLHSLKESPGKRTCARSRHWRHVTRTARTSQS